LVLAQAITKEGLSQHRRRRRAVAGYIVGLLGDLLDQLGAEALERILELDLLGDGDAVIRDGRRPPLLLEDDVAALGSEGDLDRVGQGVHPLLHGPARFLVERELLYCHSHLLCWAPAGCFPQCSQLTPRSVSTL
jgi:hypothetical protein